MSKVDFVIVGQGIAGTVLAHKLLGQGCTLKVIDDAHQSSSSTKAAGIINPITGRAYVKSWMIDDLLPEAVSTYESIAELLDSKFFHEHNIIRVLGSIAEENKWYSRINDDAYSNYIVSNADTSAFESSFHNYDDKALIRGGRVLLRQLLSQYRSYLLDNDMLKSEVFDHTKLEYQDDFIRYQDIETKYLVFAEGVRSKDNMFFPNLPFQPVKGEVLLVKIPGYTCKDIVKHGIFVCPFEEDLYWVGSGYEHHFKDDQPTTQGRSTLIDKLDFALKLPYEIVDHIAGVRPSVKGRKPLLGQSHVHDNIYLFGGMGTKGSSLVPYWAKHLIEVMLNGAALHPEVDWRRFMD